MKKNLFYLVLALFFSACKTPETPESAAWVSFKKCATNNCVKEVIAVKNAFLANPKPLLTDFQATYEKGEDHVIGWLYILRDSVLLNPKMGTTAARFDLQQKLIKVAKPFENDPKVKEMAKSVLDVVGDLAIMSETEDPVVEPSDVPILSKKDSAAAANLIGEWQSTTDPKSSIKIANGTYMDSYVGQKPMPAMRYVYYPTCPKDCNPIAKTPCLKVIGQDDVCYTIVKADGKTLALSQIGGTGNTNRYVKKKAK